MGGQIPGRLVRRRGPAPAGTRGTHTVRRALVLAAASVAAVCVILPGCSFELQRPPDLAFRTLALAGFAPRSPLAEELRTRIDASPATRVVEPGRPAQVVLEAISEAREKTVVASTAVGQVREFRLGTRFNFRLRDSAGRELGPATEILLSRDLSYSETVALGKQEEEAFLYRSMQSDIVAQVLRRLASLQGF